MLYYWALERQQHLVATETEDNVNKDNYILTSFTY